MIPKILYHGTSAIRYELGIMQQGLRGDIDRHLLVDNNHLGYVFLCDDPRDAAFYALLTCAFDDTVPKWKKLNDITGKGVILGVRTSNFKHDIEVDPERLECENDYKKDGLWEIAQKYYFNGNWYRMKGSIPRYKMFAYGEVPFHKQDAVTMQLIKTSVEQRTFEERMNLFFTALKNGKEATAK